MKGPTKKWRFRHCFWIQGDAEVEDFEPLTAPYRFKHTRPAPSAADAQLTDVELRPDPDATEVLGQTNWCVTGTIETLGTLSEEEVDDFSWEVVSEHAYQVVQDLIWGNEWYAGGVEPLEEGGPRGRIFKVFNPAKVKRRLMR